MLCTDRMESCRRGMNLEPRLPSSGDSGRFLVTFFFFSPLLRFDKSQPGTPPPPPPRCLSATADGDCDTNNSVQAGSGSGSVDVPQPTTTCVLNFAHQSRRRGQHARRSSASPSEENAARCKHAEALSTLFFSFYYLTSDTLTVFQNYLHMQMHTQAVECMPSQKAVL